MDCRIPPFLHFRSFCVPVLEPRFGGSSVPRLGLITDHGSRITDAGPPAAGGAENDVRLTLHTRGPPTFRKVEGEVFMVGPPEILDESTWDPGRRSRAMLICALETNGNGRLGTLRFSLWKPSPSALCFFSFKSWWLAGAGLVARGRHLMVPELSSGAPGSPYAAMHFRTKMHAGFLLDSGPGGSLARWGGVPVCPKSL